MANDTGTGRWVPLLTKLVWPLFILVMLWVFQAQVRELYGVVVSGIKSGRAVEIAGLLKLGEAASRTAIGELSLPDLPVARVGTSSGVVRKGGSAQLEAIQQELEDNPGRSIDTLLVPDGITYSIPLLKEYIGTLGLRYVVFQHDGRFDGWLPAGPFVAQLPEGRQSIGYDELRATVFGVSPESVEPTASTREVLERMQALHLDSLPVVDAEGRWLSFANRGEILSQLLSALLLEKTGRPAADPR